MGVEKFVNIHGVLNPPEIKTLEGVEVKTIGDFALISSKGEMPNEHLQLKIDKSFLVGVQTHEGGGKSLIVTHTRENKVTGDWKQTIRRYTAVPENQ